MKTPALVWVGGISYEFYLIHESLSISALSKINQTGEIFNNPQIQLLLIFLVIAILTVLSSLLKRGAKILLEHIKLLFSHSHS